MAGVERQNEEAQRTVEEALARKEKLERARQSVIENFNSNRIGIIRNVRDFSEQGEWDNALRISEKYLITGGSELEDLHSNSKNEVRRIENEKRTQIILEKLNGVPVENYNENLELYRQLVSMHP